MSMKTILGFGELLLRFSPVINGEWLRSNQMPVFIGGAELNVVTALAKWNVPVSYCTALPDNYLSQDLLISLNTRNINTDSIVFSGERIGTYFLAQGMDMKNNAVIYDRAYSSFAELKTGMIDWDAVFENVSWFHFSAISPSLNDSAAEVCLEALQAASKKNITISVDLNYRPKLWKQRSPHKTMQPLLEYCDVVMGNIWSAHDLLGIPLESPIRTDKSSYLNHAHNTSLRIMERFARVKSVACTFRFKEGEQGIYYYASLYSENQWVESPVFQTEKAIDQVGTGDCFMAGLIYGLDQQLPPAEVIQFASSAAFGKFFEKGDATNQDVESIRARIEATTGNLKTRI